MSDLLSKKCVPCSVDTDPLDREEINEYLDKVDKDWSLQDDGRIERTYKFDNFKQALDFTNKVGELAEEEGHHPSIFLAWGMVRVRLWTNNIKGLHENDFVMAAKIDEL